MSYEDKLFMVHIEKRMWAFTSFMACSSSHQASSNPQYYNKQLEVK